MHRLGICSRAVRGLVADVLVPGLIGAAVLVVVDIIRDESAPWWMVAVIFLLVFSLYEGLRYMARRGRR
jgi:FtsH-binding integral membrane protein